LRTWSVTLASTCELACSVIPCCTKGANPSFSTRTRYSPSGNSGRTYWPAESLADERDWLVPMLVAVTAAPGTTAPVASRTVPLMVPDVCAWIAVPCAKMIRTNLVIVSLRSLFAKDHIFKQVLGQLCAGALSQGLQALWANRKCAGLSGRTIA